MHSGTHAPADARATVALALHGSLRAAATAKLQPKQPKQLTDDATRKSAMQRCSYTSYRDGSWQSNATATAPYRCLPGPYDIAAQLLFNALTGHIEGAPVAGAQNKAGAKGRGRGKAAGGRGRAPTRSVSIPRGRGPLRGKAPAT